DYVVIGGGPAGFVVAEQLSADPNVTVVLLEAGPENAGVEDIDVPIFAPYLLRTVHAFNYTSQPEPFLNGNAPVLDQGRGFGGGSAINYMGHCRGAASIFDEWAEISGDEGLRFENLLSSFLATSYYNEEPIDFDPHLNLSAYGNGPLELVVRNDDVNAEQRFIDAFSTSLSLPWTDLNDGTGLGVATATLGIRASNRTRIHAGQAFGWLMGSRPNVALLHDAHVTHIGFRHRRAHTVTYTNPADPAQTRTLRPKEVILAAGAISSPKLLMLSGVGPAWHLREKHIPVVLDVPELGRNLRDHHFAFLEYEVTDEVETLWRYERDAEFAAQINAEYARVPAQGPVGEPNGAAFAVVRAPDEVFAGLNSTFHVDLPADRGQLLMQVGTVAFRPRDNFTNVVSPFVAVVQPEESGYVLLNTSDWRDDPLIFSNYWGSEGDKRAIKWGWERLRRVFEESEALKPILVRELWPGKNVTRDEDVWDVIRQGASSFHHPIGTNSLGKVVEGNTFRVKGLKGIRVVDSSTFPYSTGCHPMNVVYGYAHHAAQKIKEQD
ncbi:choline dehydrogenase, partial [Elsinoe ampelina]